MAQITIDTNDEKPVIVAVRNMLTELVGELPDPVHTGEKAARLDLDPYFRNFLGEVEPKTSEAEKVDDEGKENAGAAGPGADAAHGATATHLSPASPTNEAQRVDTKGVVFDPEYCGEATEPFYGSGRAKGQWKKRRGVDAVTYDAWYAEQLAAVDDLEADDLEADDLDTGAAFGATASQTADDVPADAGEFMNYVSELQGNGHVTQDQIGQAYVAAGVQITDLFPPNTPDVIAEKVAAVYNQLQVVLA